MKHIDIEPLTTQNILTLCLWSVLKSFLISSEWYIESFSFYCISFWVDILPSCKVYWHHDDFYELCMFGVHLVAHKTQTIHCVVQCAFTARHIKLKDLKYKIVCHIVILSFFYCFGLFYILFFGFPICWKFFIYASKKTIPYWHSS